MCPEIISRRLGCGVLSFFLDSLILSAIGPFHISYPVCQERAFNSQNLRLFFILWLVVICLFAFRWLFGLLGFGIVFFFCFSLDGEFIHSSVLGEKKE